MSIPFLAFLPWFFYIYPTIATHTAEFWIRTTTINDLAQSIGVLFTAYEPFYGYYDNFIIPLSLFLTIFVIFQSICYFHRERKKHDRFILFALWSFLFYIGILTLSFIKPIFHFRYLIFAPIGFNLFLFHLLEQTPRKTFLTLITILFVLIVHYTLLESSSRRKGDMKKTIHEIKTMAGEKDLIYVADPTLYFSVSYYFDEKRVFVYEPTSIPYYIGKVLIPHDKIVIQFPLYPQKAFILKNDTYYEIRAMR